MNKIDSTEKASRLVVKSQRRRSKNSGPKRNPEASNNFVCYFCKKLGHTKKNCMKYKEMLKKKGSKNSDRASTSRKTEQVRVVEQADENPHDVLTSQSGKDKYSDAWLLDSGCTYHMYPKKKWFSTYKPYNGGSVLMDNDTICKTVGISNIRMSMFNEHVRTLMNVRQVSDLRKNRL